MNLLSLLNKICCLLFLAMMVAVTAPAVRSQILEDDRGQSIHFKQDGDKFIYTIYSPHVHTPQTNYKNIVFRPGDRVTVQGSGCVQTGGIGPTWKRYVDPFAPDALMLYHGLVGMPYLDRTYRDSGIVPRLVRIQRLIGKVYVVPAYKGDSAEPYYLRLGYEDTNYDDNGYYRHDNGTGGQCYRTTEAKVVITITREVPTTGGFNLEGSWSYTATNSSGAKFTGGLTLRVNGSQVTGTLSTPDGSRPHVSGTYDEATGTLRLTRDTGLETIQRYTLRRLGNKLSGSYVNEGKYADSGTIEIIR